MRYVRSVKWIVQSRCPSSINNGLSSSCRVEVFGCGSSLSSVSSYPTASLKTTLWFLTRTSSDFSLDNESIWAQFSLVFLEYMMLTMNSVSVLTHKTSRPVETARRESDFGTTTFRCLARFFCFSECYPKTPKVWRAIGWCCCEHSNFGCCTRRRASQEQCNKRRTASCLSIPSSSQSLGFSSSNAHNH